MRKKALNRINTIIAFLLGLFGVGCGHYEVKYGVPDPGIQPAEYGCPYVSLEVSGTIKNEAEQPLKDIKVDISYYGFEAGSVLSDEEGKYNLQNSDGHVDSVDIVVKDPAGIYESDSVRVPTETRMFDSWDEWQEGESTVHQDFQLKKKH